MARRRGVQVHTPAQGGYCNAPYCLKVRCRDTHGGVHGGVGPKWLLALAGRAMPAGGRQAVAQGSECAAWVL